MSDEFDELTGAGLNEEDAAEIAAVEEDEGEELDVDSTDIDPLLKETDTGTFGPDSEDENVIPGDEEEAEYFFQNYDER